MYICFIHLHLVIVDRLLISFVHILCKFEFHWVTPCACLCTWYIERTFYISHAVSTYIQFYTLCVFVYVLLSYISILVYTFCELFSIAILFYTCVLAPFIYIHYILKSCMCLHVWSVHITTTITCYSTCPSLYLHFNLHLVFFFVCALSYIFILVYTLWAICVHSILHLVSVFSPYIYIIILTLCFFCVCSVHTYSF